MVLQLILKHSKPNFQWSKPWTAGYSGQSESLTQYLRKEEFLNDSESN